MQTVNENTTLVIELAFRDENNVPSTPTVLSYSLYNYTASTIVKDASTITVTGSTQDLEISHSYNSILNPDNLQEMMLLTVDFTYDTTKHGTSEYRYLVRNLKKIP